MTPFWHQVAVVVKRDAIVEGRSWEALAVTIPFGLVALFVIPAAVGPDPRLLSTVSSGLFWSVTLLFGLFVTLRQTAAETAGQRELLVLLGLDPVARFVGRALVSALLLIAFQMVAAPVTVVLYNTELVPGWPLLVIVVLLVASALAMLGTISGDITSGLRTRTALAPLLVAPLAFPLLLAAAAAVEGLRRGNGILIPVLLLAITNLVIGAAGVLTARPLEEATR